MVFESWWPDRFGAIRPLGHELHGYIPDRWFRIHSLPESKRWPSEEAEHAEVLRRHNAVASEVLGEGATCWLVFVTYDIPPVGVESETIPELPCLTPGNWSRPLLFRELDETQPGEEELISICHAMEIKWAPGRFDDLIRLVATDRAPQVLFAEQERGRVYAPYDGGADLFLESSEQRDDFRVRYRGWLSSHPLGL